MADTIDKEARGQGMGVGSNRQQDGGTDQCVCPKCDARVKHDRGTPCAEMKCPKCGAVMAGAPAEKSAQESLDDLLLLTCEREVTESQQASIDFWCNVHSGKQAECAEAINSMCLALREQAVMKTEGGQKYPAAAFAYVPDAEKPSTWKLRLWESPSLKVTRKQLGAAASAFSPGGHRGQPVQLPSGEVAKVKGRIRAAYRSLKVEPQNIPKSVQEAEPM